MTPRQAIERLMQALTRPGLFAGLLLWLMGLLLAGTIAEKALGLYRAQQLYFSSYIIWLGGYIPLPGILTVTAVIFAGLACKLARDRWQWRNLGTIIVHIGAAVLLLGGFLTAQFSSEGAMVIPPNASRDYIEDYHRVELAVTPSDGAAETVFPENSLAAGGVLGSPALPFTIENISWCRNCGLLRLPQPVTEGNPHGVAINFVLKPLPRDAQEENNRAGLTFRLQNSGDKNGLYAIFESMPIPEIIDVVGNKYLLSIRPARTKLPFSVKLLHFTQDFYPGTDKPRAYQSDVVLQDHGVLWHSLISMNEPLRYKGYTFYQSSFTETDGGTATVLAVVKNIGRLFPYISSIIIALGLLIHLVQRLNRRGAGAS